MPAPPEDRPGRPRQPDMLRATREQPGNTRKLPFNHVTGSGVSGRGMPAVRYGVNQGDGLGAHTYGPLTQTVRSQFRRDVDL